MSTYTFRYTRKAKRLFEKLDPETQKRIQRKFEQLHNHLSLYSLLEPLTEFDPATHRLRIGEYRALLADVGGGEFLILKVGHRSTIYQRSN